MVGKQLIFPARSLAYLVDTLVVLAIFACLLCLTKFIYTSFFCFTLFTLFSPTSQSSLQKFSSNELDFPQRYQLHFSRNFRPRDRSSTAHIAPLIATDSRLTAWLLHQRLIGEQPSGSRFSHRMGLVCPFVRGGLQRLTESGGHSISAISRFANGKKAKSCQLFLAGWKISLPPRELSAATTSHSCSRRSVKRRRRHPHRQSVLTVVA